MKPMFFTADDLAKRWGISPEQVLQYGAEGLLQFGVYVDGLLFVEIGKTSHYPELEFKREAFGPWSGFVPVKKSMVARCWLHGGTEHLEIPDTDCGKEVRVESYIPSDEDQSFRLLVSADDLEKFERGQGMYSPGVNITSDEKDPPKEWSRGLKRVAFDSAMKIFAEHGGLTGAALWESISMDSRVALTGDTARYKLADASFKQGETEAKASTVKRYWAGHLKGILNT